MQKKKRRRFGYGPMGTPGASPRQTHASALRGRGRLGKAMRSLAKERSGPPTTAGEPTPRELARWANDGGKVAPAAPALKPLTKSVQSETNTMPKKSQPAIHIAERSTNDSPAIGRSKANLTNQVGATTAAKRARIEEAGLDGPRVGEESARTKAAQSRRDTRRAKAAATVKSPKARAGSQPVLKKSPAAKKVPASKVRMARPTPFIKIRASSSVEGSANLDAYARSVVARGLSRFAGRLTRISVYLSDENAEKESPNDKRCQIEARPASQKPVSVSATATQVKKALSIAVGKMKRLLSARFDKQSRH
jgi:hypothetical protein